MEVVICGAGRVGQGIAHRLTRERHDVTLIDEDAQLVQRISAELDVRGVVGHAAHPDVLKAAGVKDCEMVIAVTHSDEINMVICKICQSMFDVPTKVARIRGQSYLAKPWRKLFSREALAIDVVISPEQEVANAILQRFETPGAILSATFGGGQLRLLGLDLSASSPLIGTSLEQLPKLFPSLDARLVGIGRGDRLFAPKVNDRLDQGDRAYLVARDTHSNRLITAFVEDENVQRKVLIVGAGNVGLHIAQRLEQQGNVQLRVIEHDDARAERAAEQLKRAIVIRGDGLNTDILQEAGADAAHVVITVTNDDKVNLLVSNLAKKLGTKRALALVNAPTLAALSDELNIDVVLDPRALTVSQILLRLRRGRFVSLQSLEDGLAEFAEGVVLDTSPLRDSPLMPESFAEGILVGAVIRDGEILFPDGKLRARSGDHVVTFFERDMTRKVEQFFRASPDFF